MNKCHCDCHADGKALEIEKPFFPIWFFFQFFFIVSVFHLCRHFGECAMALEKDFIFV